MRLPRLEQVPFVPVQILKHGDRAVMFLPRFADELDAPGGHGVVVAPEVVGVKEQKNAASGLIADAGSLFLVRTSGQKQTRAERTGWRDQDPSLVIAHAILGRSVFDDRESERLGKEGNGLVVITNQQRDMGDEFGHEELSPRLAGFGSALVPPGC